MKFFTMLGLLFIGLKLAGFITWSWWLVLLPLYGGYAIFALFMIGAIIVGAKVSVKKRR